MMAAPKGHAAYNVNGEGGAPKIHTKAYIDKLADELFIWMQEKENLFIQKFAYEKNFNHRKVSEFKQISQRFNEACDKLDAKQQFTIFDGGLKRKYAHPMCALILSCNHNIHAKTETTVTNNNQDSLASILDDIDGNTKDLI